jgi:hypothetical protein
MELSLRPPKSTDLYKVDFDAFIYIKKYGRS